MLRAVHPDFKTLQSHFLFLAVDLPPPPLFQDAVEKNIIPQVTLASVLAKYDGRTVQVWPFYLRSSAPLIIEARPRKTAAS